MCATRPDIKTHCKQHEALWFCDCALLRMQRSLLLTGIFESGRPNLTLGIALARSASRRDYIAEVESKVLERQTDFKVIG